MDTVPSPYDVINCWIDVYPFVINASDTMVNFRGEINQSIGTDAGEIEPFEYTFNLDLNQDSVDDLQFLVMKRENSGRDFKSWGVSASITSLHDAVEIICQIYPDSIAQYWKDNEQFSESWNIGVPYPSSTFKRFSKFMEPAIFEEGDKIFAYNIELRKSANYYEYFACQTQSSGSTLNTNSFHANWSNIGTYYTGIKFTYKNHILLGWVNLSVETNKITLNRYVLKTVL